LLPKLEVAPPAKRIGHLDGLRGYLAFSVLLHHSAISVASIISGKQWTLPARAIFDQLGAGAVALFFMVSGTVFYPLVLKGISADWMGFIIKRLFRILPMVTLSVTLVLLVLMAVTGRSPGPIDLLAFLIWVSSWDQPPLLGVLGAKYLNALVLWSLHWE
jgi:peptidoglycan/LPS O-acetylase OafA/YrhL